MKAYLLDPDQLTPPTHGEAHPQALDPDTPALDSDPLRKLIRVDEIGAQRGLGFSPSRSDDEDRPQVGEILPALPLEVEDTKAALPTAQLQPPAPTLPVVCVIIFKASFAILVWV